MSDCFVDDTLTKARLAFEANPDNLRLFDKYLQLLIKLDDLPTALQLIDQSTLLKNQNAESGLVYAHLLYKMKRYNEADVAFEEAIASHPQDLKLRLLYAQTLKKRRKVIQAYHQISQLDKTLLDEKQSSTYEEIANLFHLVQNKEIRPLDLQDDFSILAMKHAILYFKDRVGNPSTIQSVGKISLITGSLGPGGAEKQLCLTAIHINQLALEQKRLSDIHFQSEVDVLINAFDTEDEKGFFLPWLKEHQVSLFQIRNMPLTDLENLPLDSPILLQLLKETPSSIRYGLNRLVQYFKQAGTEIAFIWQDSAILFSVLAALVAGVPRIVLNFRGYPPSLRPHLFKPEYYDLYTSLAQISGVSFVTNTYATAQAYAQWLDIPLHRFTVIYNGISSSLAIDSMPEEALMWEHFKSKNPEARQVIGGVFRFETDKRPILFIRFIKRYLHSHPNTCFVLVGEGRLRNQCMKLAEELKIDHSILFVGLSKRVGYWMSKMDAMVLLSLYEGLPNVLIEAQLMGLPVVSTPAGGAQECFIEGETGCILSNGLEPDLYEACQKVSALIDAFNENPSLKNKAKEFANTQFSIARMIEQTVRVLAKSRCSAYDV